MRPQWASSSGRLYSPGIGPHTESATIELVLDEIRGSCPSGPEAATSVPYPGSRQRCDVVVDGEWAIEAKLLRFMGDNGKRNDNMLSHILSPYPTDRSALTDCDKLASAGFLERRAIVIFGYDYDDCPMDPAIEAFEVLATARHRLGTRAEAAFEGLVHPVHQRGRVFAWELLKT